MIISSSSLRSYDYPNDMIMSLIEAADNCAELFDEGSSAVYVYYSDEGKYWIICDNFDRGEYNAIRCYDNGTFTIWDSRMLKEFSYVEEFNGNRITSYEAAYQHAKQFFRANSTSQLKGVEHVG